MADGRHIEDRFWL